MWKLKSSQLAKPFAISFFILLILSAALFREFGLVTSQPVNSWKEDPTADCAVVLTGGSNRLREGLDLLSRGHVRKLIISGVHGSATLREIYPLWPFYGDVKEQDVILERRSGTTYGNAQQTISIVEALNCRDVVLVTSNLHIYRAYRTFEASYPSHISLIKYAVNSGRGESGVWDISTEVLKSLFYSLWAY